MFGAILSFNIFALNTCKFLMPVVKCMDSVLALIQIGMTYKFYLFSNSTLLIQV